MLTDCMSGLSRTALKQTSFLFPKIRIEEARRLEIDTMLFLSEMKNRETLDLLLALVRPCLLLLLDFTSEDKVALCGESNTYLSPAGVWPNSFVNSRVISPGRNASGDS